VSDPAALSRVELEPVMFRALALGDTDTASAIWAELGRRVWQNVNPYLGAPPWAGGTGTRR
jgi:hypothetical protein